MRMYEVIYKAYVVAEDQEDAEMIAREMNLTIQDSSVKASNVNVIIDPKIISAAEKLISSLFQLPKMNSDQAVNILKCSLKDFTNAQLSDEQIHALYSHCEREYLLNN